MFFPGAIGAAAGASSALHRRRQQHALNHAIHDAMIQDLYERTPVLVMKVGIQTASLQQGLLKKVLKAKLTVEGKELLLSEPTKAAPEETQCARFDFNVATSFILEGDDILCFEIVQPQMVMPSKTLGRCLMPLSEVREALGGTALTRVGGQQLVQELVLSVPKKKPEEILGGMQVVIMIERTTLAALGGDAALGEMRSLPSQYRDSVPQYRPSPFSSGPAPSFSTASQPATRPAAPQQQAAQRQVVQGSVVSPGAGTPVVGTVVGQPPQQGQPGQSRESTPFQVLQTADGGEYRMRSWIDATSGELKTEAILTDAQGNEIQRVEWSGAAD